MKKINILNSAAMGCLIFSLFYFVATVQAVNVSGANITYPIETLGNCPDQAACAVYCEKIENMDACVSFAAQRGLISEREAAIAKKAIVKIKAGETPGGCTSQESCENYCQNNMASLNSCLSFAEGLGISGAELDQAKRIAAALQSGAKLPGDCQGKMACESYCKNINHLDECLAFAEAAQILPAAELAEAKKVAPFLKNGQTPGGCQEKAACQAYCAAEGNFSECLSFAEKAGFVSKSEAEIARKTGGQGPGGCKSKQACQDYCNIEENAKVCADFALEKGLLSEADADNIKNGVAKIKSGLEQVPGEIKGEVEACLNNLFGGKLSAVLAGEQILTEKQGNRIGACFEDAAKAYARQQMNQGAAASNAPAAGDLKNLEKAPAEVQAEVKNRIEQETQSRQQQAIEANTPKDIPTGPPAGQDIPGNAASYGPPANIPTGPPAGIPTGPPANLPQY